MASLWQTLEDLPGLVAVDRTWVARLGSHHPAVRSRLLRRRQERASTFPCPHGCGCSHSVVVHKGQQIVAVCQCEDRSCEDVVLAQDDLVLWELSWRALGREVARAFDFPSKDADMGMRFTRQIGEFGGAAMPIVLTIQHDREQFRNVVSGLVAQLREHFVLLAPTGHFMDANTHALLNNGRAGFCDLESHLILLATGELRAPKSGGELFSRYLASKHEPVDEDNCVTLFRLVKALADEHPGCAAPVLTVFHLYVVKALSRAAVAKQCGCSKSLITLRLRSIENRLGRKPIELRQLSSHFERIEESLTDPRARRINRRSASNIESADADDQV